MANPITASLNSLNTHQQNLNALDQSPAITGLLDTLQSDVNNIVYPLADHDKSVLDGRVQTLKTSIKRNQDTISSSLEITDGLQNTLKEKQYENQRMTSQLDKIERTFFYHTNSYLKIAVKQVASAIDGIGNNPKIVIALLASLQLYQISRTFSWSTGSYIKIASTRVASLLGGIALDPKIAFTSMVSFALGAGSMYLFQKASS